MTDKQLLEQALEALEDAIDHLPKPNSTECGYVITAIKQALAAPVQYELSPTHIYDFAGWLTTRKGVMKVGSSCEAGPMAEAVGEYLKTFPNRFTAAQRKWVGLTDEEMYFAIRPLYKTDALANAAVALSKDEYRAIEAKLKEKNT